MLEIKVTVTLAPEVMNLIRSLAIVKTQPETEQPDTKETPKKETPKIEKNTSKITKDTLRSLVLKAAKAHSKETVKNLLKEFDTKNVTDMDPKHHEAFYGKLKELL